MRRTFRRHIRKTLSQNVPPVLQEANFAFDKGEYGRAAKLYEDIARTVDTRGGLRAPLPHLQAGRSRVYAGQTQAVFPPFPSLPESINALQSIIRPCLSH